jgi:hypothetical protein
MLLRISFLVAIVRSSNNQAVLSEAVPNGFNRSRILDDLIYMGFLQHLVIVPSDLTRLPEEGG